MEGTQQSVSVVPRGIISTRTGVAVDRHAPEFMLSSWLGGHLKVSIQRCVCNRRKGRTLCSHGKMGSKLGRRIGGQGGKPSNKWDGNAKTTSGGEEEDI